MAKLLACLCHCTVPKTASSELTFLYAGYTHSAWKLFSTSYLQDTFKAATNIPCTGLFLLNINIIYSVEA